MSEDALELSARLADLRSSFDHTFAERPAAALGARLRLLAIHVGGHGFVVRLDQVSGIEKSRRLVTLPGAPAALLGLMGVRGTLVPVFSLARIAGEDAGAPEPWVIFTGGREPIGLAVASFDGHEEVAPGDIVAVPAATGRYVAGQVRIREVEMGVIDLTSILEGIMRAGAADPRRSAER